MNHINQGLFPFPSFDSYPPSISRNMQLSLLESVPMPCDLQLSVLSRIPTSKDILEYSNTLFSSLDTLDILTRGWV